jgi:hypothetical protein
VKLDQLVLVPLLPVQLVQPVL